jgi:hypothetical protein
LNMYYWKIGIIIFFKIITMSIWIILKSLICICRECNFCWYWAIITCIYPITFVQHARSLPPWPSLLDFELLGGIPREGKESFAAIAIFQTLLWTMYQTYVRKENLFKKCKKL